MVETITALFASLQEYFSNFDLGEAVDSVKMIIENFDLQLIKDTFSALVEFIQSIFG